MKSSCILTICLLIGIYTLHAQVSINTDGSPSHPSAMLDVKSSTSGFLFPRMTFLQRNAIENPANGLMVYCTDCNMDGTGILSVFVDGSWKVFDFVQCMTAQNPSAAQHIPEVTQITWKWHKSHLATGYKWSNNWNYSTAIDIGADTVHIDTSLQCNTYYQSYVWAYNDCDRMLQTGQYYTPTILMQRTLPIPFGPPPTPGTPIPTVTQVVWNWNPTPDATGYKWNYTNNYSTAIDMSASTTCTETGVACGSTITRYVWAYNTCGYTDAVTLTATTQSAGCPVNCTPFTDSRDGKTYGTVIIGTRCWMSENMNIGSRISGTMNQTNNGIVEKYCYENQDSNCTIYGGLYQWGEMVQYLNGASNATFWNPAPTGNVEGICPQGWHIPTDAEWSDLRNFLGGESVAGGKMKEAGFAHWNSYSTLASNASGFTGLPAGYRAASFFNGKYDFTIFWSSTGNDVTTAWDAGLWNSTSNFTRYGDDNKIFGFSVRCVRND